jgi:hypothetical protein
MDVGLLSLPFTGTKFANFAEFSGKRIPEYSSFILLQLGQNSACIFRKFSQYSGKYRWFKHPADKGCTFREGVSPRGIHLPDICKDL